VKAVIQRVNKAKVIIGEDTHEISCGMVIFAAVAHGDTENDVKWLADKCVNLRIFSNDEKDNDKLDKSILDIKGDILVVSQFTLYGDCRKGRRPDFTQAAKPDYAKPLYERFVNYLQNYNLKIVTGKFQSSMLVEIHNDGPVTLIVDSKQ
jgi:D-tyrosyl-tRNA(Tyr) deacylase